MSVEPAPGRYRRQCACVAVLGRNEPHHILAGPRLAPDVGKAEEGERGPNNPRYQPPAEWSRPVAVEGSMCGAVGDLGGNYSAHHSIPPAAGRIAATLTTIAFDDSSLQWFETST